MNNTIIKLLHHDDGLIEVSLINCQKNAILHEEVFNDLMSLGISPRWLLMQGHVRCKMGRKRYVSIARLITDCGQKQIIKYLDGEPTNLRTANLVLAEGSAKMRARDNIEMNYPPEVIEFQHSYKEH
jgi:hypothetical protein